MSDPISVVIREQGGARIPSRSQAHVVAGTEITFQAVGAQATLFFSPDLAAILSPEPDSPAVINPGSDLSFTLTGDDPGAYEILFAAPGSAVAPSQFDPPLADRKGFIILFRSINDVGKPLSSSPGHAVPPTPVGAGGVTSNPIQTIHAHGGTDLGVTSNPIQTFFGSADSDDLDITSNPIQT